MANAIIQARTGSTRLPGKVLKRVRGVPLIDYLLLAVQDACLVENIIAAVPEGDLELIDHLRQRCNVVIGPEDNVAGRFGAAITAFPCEYFVRVCADSPLMDRAVIDIAISQSKEYDIVKTKGFPRGQQVEVVNSEVFMSALPFIEDPYDREHVTPYFYRGDYNIGYVENIFPSGPDMVVDTEEDFIRISKCIETVKMPWLYRFDQLQAHL